jgi:hypothetical protein
MTVALKELDDFLPRLDVNDTILQRHRGRMRNEAQREKKRERESCLSRSITRGVVIPCAALL